MHPLGSTGQSGGGNAPTETVSGNSRLCQGDGLGFLEDTPANRLEGGKLRCLKMHSFLFQDRAVFLLAIESFQALNISKQGLRAPGSEA